ncbi:dTDP-glucose 4,6-dehydratase [Sulfurovum sp. NBC37-1]|uniref:dTDP-glucose 4,6-dehydratase n=1 Tax=Sulfurovum sp. (strain NBC37-1) TaxID=387093 RepID=UPI0001587BA7|nr:dTDP-glucose 4,6-dehydratase [Sulfurovum sp. NBC37-1]BAF72503.1 dTDP-glucose 4,6-dehydratase [Sulfurovum sp. NBC37-1]
METLTTKHSPLKTILVTGCAGFIGSNFVPYFLEKYPNYRIVNLDLLTYAGNLDNLKEVEDILNNNSTLLALNADTPVSKEQEGCNTQHSTLQNDRYHFVKGNICNRELVEFIFNEYDVQAVIHFAAESHVDNSIKNPGVFVETNVNGTFTLLDVAYKYWMEKPFKYRERYMEGVFSDECFTPRAFPNRAVMSEKEQEQEQEKNNCPTEMPLGATLNTHHSKLDEITLPRFHHISTDEVYGTLSDDPDDLFTEETPYAPNSPYSASKASSDMIVRSYVETYGMDCVITNCSNNYGPKQHDEKLIPTIIRKALVGESIPIYGDGKNIRDWLYVLDHCKGIDLAYHTGKKGEVYNIGGRNERTNLQIVDRICEILDEKIPPQTNSKLLALNGDTPVSKEQEGCNTKHLTLKSYKDLVTFVDDRAGHDRRYAIDATKIENELGWKADEDFDSGIVKTVEWYLEKYLTKHHVSS